MIPRGTLKSIHSQDASFFYPAEEMNMVPKLTALHDWNSIAYADRM